MFDVFIVEDDEAFCEILTLALLESKKVRVVGTARSGEAALREIPRSKAEVILMDIKLPGLEGIECLRRLKGFPPLSNASVLILTEHADSNYVFEALKAGANGYLLKDHIFVRDVSTAINDVKNGGGVMSPAIARKVINHFQKPPLVAAALSERENEVLRHLADGLMYKEIAARLDISLNTIRKHVGTIYVKLHVRSRTDATRVFLQRHYTKV
jgi:DNA-binding NarL/FixJ family response regulator